MFHLGTTELIIIFLIIVLLFGAGRIGKIAGEMGKGIREFRSGLTGKDEKEKTGENNEPIDQTKDDPQV